MFDQLDIELPSSCTNLGPNSTGCDDAIMCGNFNYCIANWSTVATIKFKGFSTYSHFDKLYPSGVLGAAKEQGLIIYM